MTRPITDGGSLKKVVNSSAPISTENLNKFDGVQNKKIFVSVLNQIFDVTKSAHLYGQGNFKHYEKYFIKIFDKK